jgi:hypothetical protein
MKNASASARPKTPMTGPQVVTLPAGATNHGIATGALDPVRLASQTRVFFRLERERDVGTGSPETTSIVRFRSACRSIGAGSALAVAGLDTASLGPRNRPRVNMIGYVEPLGDDRIVRSCRGEHGILTQVSGNKRMFLTT